MKLLLSTIALLLATCSWSQENHEKIKEAYGEEEYEQLSKSDPGFIYLLDAYISNGFLIAETNDKYADAAVLDVIPLRSKSEETISVSAFLEAYNSNDFNALNYKFFPGKEAQVYQLAGSDKVLIILATHSIISK